MLTNTAFIYFFIAIFFSHTTFSLKINHFRTELAYFNADSKWFHRCDKGLVGAVVEAMDSDESLITLLSSLFADEEKPEPTTRSKRSIQHESSLFSVQNKTSHFETELDQFDPSVDKAIRLNGAVKNFIRLFRIMIEHATINQTSSLTKRQLQSSEISDLMANMRFIMHALSPPFLKLFSLLVLPDQHGNMLYEAPQKAFGTVLCEAMEFAIRTERNIVNHWCALFNVVLAVITCGPKDEFFCDTNAVTTPKWVARNKVKPQRGPYANVDLDLSSHEIPIKITLQDIRQGDPPILPSTLSDEQEKEEAFFYAVLLRSVEYAALHTLYLFSCPNYNADQNVYIPGWKLIYFNTYQQVIHTQDPVQNYIKELPLLHLLESEEVLPDKKCQFILLFRGTINNFEWIYDIKIDQVEFLAPGAKMHVGFQTLTVLVVNDLIKGFRELDITNKCSAVELLLSGVSLGGALTQTVALTLAHIFPKFNITTVSFVSPRIFNEKSLTLFRRLVNGRNIEVEYDSISALPCTINETSGMYVCDGPFTKDNFHRYVPNAATYILPFSEYNKYVNYSSNYQFKNGTGEIQLPIPLQTSASHGCALGCILSKSLHPPDVDISKLWNCRPCS